MVDNEDRQRYFRYLERLRESGVTNMFGATPYLMREFRLSKSEAREVLLDWITNGGGDG